MDRTISLKPKAGGEVPLFDRLSDDEPVCDGERVSLRVYDRDAVLASVMRELDRLLNTRSNLPMSRWEDAAHTVIDYGLPDYAHLSPRNGAHRDQLSRVIARAIADYEPRLRHPRVTPLPPDEHDVHRFRFTVAGELVIGDIIEPVSFPIAL